MRKVIAATFVSLDGVMQAPGGPEEDTAGGFKFGGWTFHHWDEVMGEAMGATFNGPFDLLLGRKTYDIFAAHWPNIQNDPIADSFNAVTKYVAKGGCRGRIIQEWEYQSDDNIVPKRNEGSSDRIRGNSHCVDAGPHRKSSRGAHDDWD